MFSQHPSLNARCVAFCFGALGRLELAFAKPCKLALPSMQGRTFTNTINPISGRKQSISLEHAHLAEFGFDALALGA